MNKNNITEIAKDGLHYKSKEGGSPYGLTNTTSSMSCYKCGLHKIRALGTFKRLLNQRMFICADCNLKPKVIKS